MHAVTNRKCCGSCRFFEASTVPGHGWCRNTAYQGSQAEVLLRAEEVACRTWGKDFYEARAGAAEPAGTGLAGIPAEQAATLPIGQGIAPLHPDDAPTEKLHFPPRPAASAFPSGGRRKPGQGHGALPTVTVPAKPAADGGLAVVGANLQGHPELLATGEMIRRPPRSVVAEAHRKALQRRESERQMAAERHREHHERAVEGLYGATRQNGANGQQRPAAAQPAIPPVDRTVLPPPGGGHDAPVIRAAMSPTPALPPAAPVEELDQPIAVSGTMLPGVPAIRATREELPSAIPAATPPSERPTLPDAPGAWPMPAPVGAAPEIAAPQVAAPNLGGGGPAGVRYWDQPGANDRFRPMRQEVTEPAPTRPPQRAIEPSPTVPTIGRPPRQEVPPPAEAPGVRTIRPWQPFGSALPTDDEGVPTVRAPRLPRQVPVAEPRLPEPTPPPPPRQVDPELLQALRRGWRERALAIDPGQRCGTCRFFQTSEGAERGSCGCTLATQSYRQAFGRDDLGCLSALGNWWAATDEGWLQKADLGTRQPTPLIDQLVAELGGREALVAFIERRREAR